MCVVDQLVLVAHLHKSFFSDRRLGDCRHCVPVAKWTHKCKVKTNPDKKIVCPNGGGTVRMATAVKYEGNDELLFPSP